MDIIHLHFENWHTLLLQINWWMIIILLVGMGAVSYLFHKFSQFLQRHSIIVSEVNLGIGNNSVTLTYDKSDQEIAYKIWVEMSTRKIGLPFDMDNDVIEEVYDSWYSFFQVTRELLKEIPVEKLAVAIDLINLTEKVLNKGLRPHLTTWHARYRRWYDIEKEIHNAASPQELQRNFPDYDNLIEDLVETNRRMIEYKLIMKQIAFGH